MFPLLPERDPLLTIEGGSPETRQRLLWAGRVRHVGCHEGARPADLPRLFAKEEARSGLQGGGTFKVDDCDGGGGRGFADFGAAEEECCGGVGPFAELGGEHLGEDYGFGVAEGGDLSLELGEDKGLCWGLEFWVFVDRDGWGR